MSATTFILGSCNFLESLFRDVVSFSIVSESPLTSFVFGDVSAKTPEPVMAGSVTLITGFGVSTFSEPSFLYFLTSGLVDFIELEGLFFSLGGVLFSITFAISSAAAVVGLRTMASFSEVGSGVLKGAGTLISSDDLIANGCGEVENTFENK